MKKMPVTLVATALVLMLQGCDRASSGAGEKSGAPGTPGGGAQASFDAMVERCTQSIAARTQQVRPNEQGTWTKTGFSPALVQAEVKATESTITPYVGKIVVKDNEAQATAPTQAQAEGITLTPAHLLSNRTHTFVYLFDGKAWRWDNASRFTKAPSRDDVTVTLSLDDMAAPASSFAPCLPR